jgi:hypothetical protein
MGAAGWVGASVTAAGAHEANRRASRRRLVLSAVEGVGKRRFFIIIISIYITV